MSGTAPQLSVAGFEGPLDFLIEQVRRQRVDLGPLSILVLTDQLVEAIEAGGTALERRADWLVMASELLLLKARLLLPASAEEAEDAGTDAARRLALLAELARMRAAAAWLGARPQLGQAVFARGRQEPPARPQAELLLAFLEATLAMLEGPLPPPEAPPPAYRPRPPELWRVPDALRHIIALLSRQPAAPLTLAECLPPIPPQVPDRPLRLRAALASSFTAGLELARDGRAVLEQAAPFAPIVIGGR